MNRKAVYLAANTRLVSDKLDIEFDECDRFFSPVFEAEEGGQPDYHQHDRKVSFVRKERSLDL